MTKTCETCDWWERSFGDHGYCDKKGQYTSSDHKCDENEEDED